MSIPETAASSKDFLISSILIRCRIGRNPVGTVTRASTVFGVRYMYAKGCEGRRCKTQMHPSRYKARPVCCNSAKCRCWLVNGKLHQVRNYETPYCHSSCLHFILWPCLHLAIRIYVKKRITSNYEADDFLFVIAIAIASLGFFIRPRTILEHCGSPKYYPGSNNRSYFRHTRKQG